VGGMGASCGSGGWTELKGFQPYPPPDPHDALLEAYTDGGKP